MIKRQCPVHQRVSLWTYLAETQELQKLVAMVELAHELVSEHLTLDPFALMMSEIMENISLVSFSGRLSTQVRHRVKLKPNCPLLNMCVLSTMVEDIHQRSMARDRTLCFTRLLHVLVAKFLLKMISES